MAVVVGITGGICSGKSTVTNILASLGACVIDADKVGHKTYEPGTDCYFKLIDAFGEAIISDEPTRTINRRALGSIVFRSKESMERLQQIVWPEIKKLLIESIAQFKSEGCAIIVVEAAIMIEAGWQDLVDKVWVVEVSKEEAISRLVARNSLSVDEAEQRLQSQLSNEERRKFANNVILNNGNKSELEAQCEMLFLSLARG